MPKDDRGQEKAIQDALVGLREILASEKIDPAKAAVLATKINFLVLDNQLRGRTCKNLNFDALGKSCLGNVIQKFVPDAPRRISLEGNVRVESVYENWLESKDKALEELKAKAAEYEILEQEMVLALEAADDKAGT